ncbi:hypothetical protein [Arthrobacter woluwensis]|uniref:hypothetical protein n=1 Tax=Arthrobacter woluwensis TaxID=156980 RepID=UPI001AAE8946|nr:hypothetical protein [Arthrobacter woluwensis]QTF71259.1 hypothetical protein G8758_03985 [Arthrobacter woluwensis]
MKNRPERTVIRYDLREPGDRSVSLSDRVESARRHAEIAAATFLHARKCRRLAGTGTNLDRETIDAARRNANVARESQRAAGCGISRHPSSTRARHAPKPMAEHDATDCPRCQREPPDLRRWLAEGELPTDYEPTKERTLPKMRGTKPELWSDEDFSEVSFGARLLFIGLWNFVCDNRHHKDEPRQIRMRIFPNDIGMDVSPLLDELVEVGLVTRSDGWVTVPNLRKHQNIDFRYFVTCDHPNCEEPEETKAFKEKRRRGYSLAPKEDAPSARRANGERSPVALYGGEGEGEVKGNEGKGGKPWSPSVAPPPPAEPTEPSRQASPGKPKTSTGHRLPDDWAPSQAVRDKMTAECPEVDQRREFPIFQDYWRSQPGAKGRKTDWGATYRNWIRRAADKAPRRASRSHPCSDRHPTSHRRAQHRTHVRRTGQ